MALDLVLSRQAEEATVWLAWRPGDVEPHWTEVVTRHVEASMEHCGSDGAYVLVLSGVEAGEMVVTEGAYAVHLASLNTSEIGHGHTH